ncbi:MAG: LCP family protein [Actinomycetota bacterium]
MVAGGLGLLVLGFLLMLLWSLWSWGSIDRVEVSGLLDSGGSGTNYLFVGSDSREGVDPNDPNAGFIIGEPVTGQRSDTVMILRVEDGGASFLSLPRDLWLPIAGTGGEQRLNTAYADGPEQLIQTVQQSLGLPVHHYLEVDLATFSDVVDAVGGVTIDFPHPAFDDKSGLDVPTAGPVELDGSQALAYVRSRAYTEIVDGREVVDPTGDIGRGLRQQQFMRVVLSDVTSTRNPLALARIMSAMSGGLTVDDSLGLRDVIGLGLSLRGVTPESVELPVFGFTTSNGAQVLGLEPEAEAVLDRFRG